MLGLVRNADIVCLYSNLKFINDLSLFGGQGQAVARVLNLLLVRLVSEGSKTDHFETIRALSLFGNLKILVQELFVCHFAVDLQIAGQFYLKIAFLTILLHQLAH